MMKAMPFAAALLLSTAPLAAQSTRDDARLLAELEQAKAAIATLQKQVASLEEELRQPAPAAQVAQTPGSPTAIPAVVPGADGNATMKTVRLTQPPKLAEQGPGSTIGHFRIAPDGLSSAVELLAGTGDGRASFSIANSSTSDGTTRYVTNQWQATLSAPLAKNGGNTSFATLSGLDTGTKLELSWDVFKMPFPDEDPPIAAAIMNRAVTECRVASPPYDGDCNKHDNKFKSRFFHGTDRADYDEDYASATIRHATGVGLHAAVGFDRFNYFATPALTKTKTSRWSFSAGGRFLLFPLPKSSIVLDGTYERSFEAADTKVACNIPAMPGFLECVSGALAPPDRSEKIILSAEGRVFFGHGEGILKRGGIAPKLEFDALSDDVALDVPIYLVPDADGKLIGGLRVGYSSKEKAVVGLFVGTALNLFP